MRGFFNAIAGSRLATLALGFVLIAIVCALVVAPLWLLATKRLPLFNALVASLAVLAIAWKAAAGIIRRWRSAPREPGRASDRE